MTTVSTLELFRLPGEAERDLLEGGRLRRLYDGLPPHRIARALLRARRADGGAQLVSRDAPTHKDRADHHANALYVWSTGDAFIGETAARGVERHVTGPYRFEVVAGERVDLTVNATKPCQEPRPMHPLL